jgi:hypothetical protein
MDIYEGDLGFICARKKYERQEAFKQRAMREEFEYLKNKDTQKEQNNNIDNILTLIDDIEHTLRLNGDCVHVRNRLKELHDLVIEVNIEVKDEL